VRRQYSKEREVAYSSPTYRGVGILCQNFDELEKDGDMHGI
jgi:hypothetical protein